MQCRPSCVTYMQLAQHEPPQDTRMPGGEGDGTIGRRLGTGVPLRLRSAALLKAERGRADQPAAAAPQNSRPEQRHNAGCPVRLEQLVRAEERHWNSTNTGGAAGNHQRLDVLRTSLIERGVTEAVSLKARIGWSADCENLHAFDTNSGRRAVSNQADPAGAAASRRRGRPPSLECPS